jgi:DNA-directed RNA polymerase subunit RPC12/RpoP
MDGLVELEKKLESEVAEVLAAARAAGAPAAEVRRVLDAITGRAAATLQSLAAQAGPSDGRVAQLRERFAALGATREREYAASLASRAGVSSVFANAKATAAQQPWKRVQYQYKNAFTYTCVHCGAPQEAALDFKCRYCGKPMTVKGDAP